MKEANSASAFLSGMGFISIVILSIIGIADCKRDKSREYNLIMEPATTKYENMERQDRLWQMYQESREWKENE